jgi:hypothetical protein
MGRTSMCLLNPHGHLTSMTMPHNQIMSLTMVPGHNRERHGLHRCGKIGGILGFSGMVCVLFSSIGETCILTKTYGTLQ